MAQDPLPMTQKQADQPLSRTDAWYLLWRTGFGATVAELDRMEGLPLSEAIDIVVSPQPESESFKKAETLLKNVALDTSNIDNLKAWWLYRIQHTANPIREKLAVMWHNHFATSYAKVLSVEHMLAQNELIRKHAMTDFRAMFHGMSEDVAMLIWLDGNANRKRHPNENFAREVMELFSLGVGNYTEDDIKEAARAFTGWHVRNDEFWFNKLQHDQNDKTVLGKTGNLNGHDIVDLCLDQDSCPQFLATKLLQTLVNHQPEKNDVAAVANVVRKHNFQIGQVIQELLASNLFWKGQARGEHIKSPLEFIMGTYRSLQARPNYQTASQLLEQLGHDLFEPPTVKGWEGGRQWINSTSLILRMNFITTLIYSDSAGKLEQLSQIASELAENDGSELQEWVRFLTLQTDNEQLKQLVKEIKSSTTANGQKRLRHHLHCILTLPDYQLM